MSKFRCKICGAEYDNMPQTCATPGCNNSNPAMWDVIVPTPTPNFPPTHEQASSSKPDPIPTLRPAPTPRPAPTQMPAPPVFAPTKKKKSGKKKLLITMLIIILILALIVSGDVIYFLYQDMNRPNDYGYYPEPTTEHSTTGSSTTEPQTEHSKINVMKADDDEVSQSKIDSYGDGNYTPLYVFGTKLKRSEVATIEFIDNFDTAPPLSERFDVSKEHDGSVYAWTTRCNDTSINDYENLYDLHFAAEGKISPESCNFLFFGYLNLVSVNFNDVFDTSKVKRMYSMFSYCKSLEEIDLSSFDTSNITGMNHMFNHCESLEEIDLSSFDTSKVTTMNGMFQHCQQLKTIDLSNFNTSNVIEMNHMFSYCISLEKIDVSSFNTSKVTTMKAMFCNCFSCSEIDITNFTTESLQDVSYMFYVESKYISSAYDMYLFIFKIQYNFNPQKISSHENFFNQP